jgi:hypothetical protein
MRNKNNLQGVRSIVSQIYSRVVRLIRSHKTIAIAFVVALLIIVAFALKSIYSVDTCKNQASIKIINESVRESFLKRIPNPDKSKADAENVYFNQYVMTISKIFLNKINSIDWCNGVLNGQPQVELVFVYRPLISDGIEPFDFERNKTDPIKQLDSPWVKLTLNKSPHPRIRAAFIWSERQYLLDQALLSGMSVSSTKSPMPLEKNTFMKYGQDYTDGMSSIFSARSLSAEDLARVNLAKRLPADILWLFRHALMSNLAMDSEGSIRVTEFRLERLGHIGYIDLTKTLINRFFTLEKMEVRYKSILDLKDTVNIDKYRFKQTAF